MRIVLDTNVVLSALLWRGTPFHLLSAIREHPDVNLYSSPLLLEELTDVLSRPSPTKRLALIGCTVRNVLAAYIDAVELVEPIDVPRVVTGDADDDQVIATALAARADLIVSGDRRHLLSMGSHQNIDIVNASEALRRLGG